MATTPHAPPPSRKKRRPAKKVRPRSALREELFNLPNTLTMGRVAVIPAVMWAMERSDAAEYGLWQAHWAVFVATSLFAAASVTDFLDGWLARNLNLQSMFGRFMDPLADKLLVLACLVELVMLDRAPTWLVVLLLSREVAITGMRAIAAEEGFELPSDRWGKWKTAMQMTGLVGLLLHFPMEVDFLVFAGVVDFHRVGLVLMLVSMVFSIISAGGYLASFVRNSLRRQTQRAEQTPQAA